MTDRLLTVAEVAERLAVKRGAVGDLIRSGRLPAIRVSDRVYRVSQADRGASAPRMVPDRPRGWSTWRAHR